MTATEQDGHEEFRQMLTTLLQDRFGSTVQLQVHILEPNAAGKVTQTISDRSPKQYVTDRAAGVRLHVKTPYMFVLRCTRHVDRTLEGVQLWTSVKCDLDRLRSAIADIPLRTGIGPR